jgi:hypothetical protein
MVLDDFKLVSIDSMFHDSCTFHVFKSMRGSKKNSQSSKLPKPSYLLAQRVQECQIMMHVIAITFFSISRIALVETLTQKYFSIKAHSEFKSYLLFNPVSYRTEIL